MLCPLSTFDGLYFGVRIRRSPGGAEPRTHGEARGSLCWMQFGVPRYIAAPERDRDNPNCYPLLYMYMRTFVLALVAVATLPADDKTALLQKMDTRAAHYDEVSRKIW